jgi:hypothetical protein
MDIMLPIVFFAWTDVTFRATMISKFGLNFKNFDPYMKWLGKKCWWQGCCDASNAMRVLELLIKVKKGGSTT